MAKRKRKVRMPRLALLDSSKIGELVRAIDQVGELVSSMRQAVPALLELSNVSRELLAVTAKLHAADQEAKAEAQKNAAQRSERGRNANATRKANASNRRRPSPADYGRPMILDPRDLNAETLRVFDEAWKPMEEFGEVGFGSAEYQRIRAEWVAANAPSNVVGFINAMRIAEKGGQQ